MRILIADDNERVRRGVAGLIVSKSGWEVCGEAKDGNEAIEKARELRPDVILLDVSMPGLSGLEAAQHLRQEAAQGGILIMSQHDPTHLLPRALEAGADACVDKSRLFTDLLPAIEKVAASRSLPD
jgi:two-component system, NarL family, response regulator NreC